MKIKREQLLQLILLILVLITLFLFFKTQVSRFVPSISDWISIKSTITPKATSTPSSSSLPPVIPIPTPASKLSATTTTYLTDPRLKNWLNKIPSSLKLTEYLSVVVIPEQKNYIFKNQSLVKTYTISTGSEEHKMPEGIWRIGEKRDSNLEEMYGPRLMFLEIWDKQKFTETTRAFHGTNEPQKIGTNFGLGCVYHHNEDILELYEFLPKDSLVVTTYEEASANWEILIGGTVVLSRGVDQRIRKHNNINYPWEKIAPLIKAADLSIVNFKSPFATECPYVPDKPVFCSQIEYVQGLNFAGIDLVSLAGNHLGDYGIEGIECSMETLSKSDILFTGAGENKTEALKPQIVILKGSWGKKLKVGFLSFNTVSGTSPPAGENSIGVAWWDKEKIKALVESLESKVDILIVMANWGIEYTHQPTQEQINLGHILIDWGVDVVAGDQAHWVQKYEEYKDGVIFYGLGNFVFDQMWSKKTRRGILVKLTVEEEKNISYKLIPIIIEDYAQPRLASEEESKEILGQIN